jgi:hypothetical protein
MSATADTLPITAETEAADRWRRIIAIVGASSGNLVEWYDFYAYAFTSICSRLPEFLPSAFSCGHWAAGCSAGSPTRMAAGYR